MFVSFPFYPLQTSQLHSRACVNTWGELSLTTTNPLDKMYSAITQCWKACIAIQQRSCSNRVHRAEIAAQSERGHLDPPPSRWSVCGLSFQVKPSVMRNSLGPHMLSTTLVASAGQHIRWPWAVCRTSIQLHGKTRKWRNNRLFFPVSLAFESRTLCSVTGSELSTYKAVITWFIPVTSGFAVPGDFLLCY